MAPPREHDARQRRRAVWLGLAIGLAVLLVGWAMVFRRPLIDDAELAEAEAVATTAISDTRSECGRTVPIGEPIDEDGTPLLRTLLGPASEHARCIDFVLAERERLRAALVQGIGEGPDPELPPWEGDVSDVETPPVPPPSWQYLATGRVLRQGARPEEREVLAACPGIDVAVETIVRHRSVCTPFDLASSVIVEGGGVTSGAAQRAIVLADALAVHARDRIRRGEPARGVSLLLAGLSLLTDMTRGRPSLVGAMIAIAGIDRLLVQLGIVLASDLSLTDGELARLQRQVLGLTSELPEPATWIADDSILVALGPLEARGWAPPPGVRVTVDPELAMGRDDGELAPGDALIVSMLHVQHHLRGVCTGAATREACGDAIGREIDRAIDEADASEGWRTWLGMALGPRALRDDVLRREYVDTLVSLAQYVRRAYRAEADLRALWILLEHRRLALAGPCPTAAALGAHLTNVPTEAGFGGHFDVFDTHLAYRPLEISAPGWLGDASWGAVRLPLLDAYCPTLPVIGAAPAPSDAAPVSEPVVP
jgi:hypothetical protein